MRRRVRRGGRAAGHRATPKSSTAAKGTRSSSRHRASAWFPRGVRSRSGRPGPAICIVVSGTIGDHGIAIMSVREGIEFETVLESDSAPLIGLARAMLAACPAIRGMRDPTRGGSVERPERAGGGLEGGRQHR